MKKYLGLIAIFSAILFACTGTNTVLVWPIINNITLKEFNGQRSGSTANADFAWKDTYNSRWKLLVVEADSTSDTTLYSILEFIPESPDLTNLTLEEEYQVDIVGTRRINSNSNNYSDSLRFYFKIGTMGDVQIRY